MSAFETIIDWLRSFWENFLLGFEWLLEAFISILQYVFFLLLDGLLSVIETAISAIDLSSVVFNYAATWSNLPTQLIWLINAVGLPQCFALLGSAYLIRLTLNLIPSVFTRV